MYVFLSVWPPAPLSLEDQDLLRSFDLDETFGPCTGLTRRERWQRADGVGLGPPAQVWSVLARLDDDSPDLSSVFSKCAPNAHRSRTRRTPEPERRPAPLADPSSTW